MQINKEIIERLNPCSNRFNNYLKYYASNNSTLSEFLSLDKISYNDKVWVMTRLLTKEQNRTWALLIAESVLHYYEKFNSDGELRKALEADRKSVV